MSTALLRKLSKMLRAGGSVIVMASDDSHLGVLAKHLNCDWQLLMSDSNFGKPFLLVSVAHGR